MKRAALYMRVSTDDQILSLQREELHAYAGRAGWAIAGSYEDEGISGTRVRRPGLDALMRDARRRRFDAVVVWRFDRMFRSTHHLIATLVEFQSLAIDFVSCREAFDTSTPSGKMLFVISAAYAEFERDVIAERTTAGMRAAQRRGVKIGRPRTRVDIDAARALLQTMRPREAARSLGVARSTLLRALDRDTHSQIPRGTNDETSHHTDARDHADR